MSNLRATTYLKILKNSLQHIKMQMGKDNLPMCKAEIEHIAIIPDLVVSNNEADHGTYLNSYGIKFIEKIGKNTVFGEKTFLDRYLEYWEVLRGELKIEKNEPKC